MKNKLYELLKYRGKEKQLDALDVFIAKEILKDKEENLKNFDSDLEIQNNNVKITL